MFYIQRITTRVFINIMCSTYEHVCSMQQLDLAGVHYTEESQICTE